MTNVAIGGIKINLDFSTVKIKKICSRIFSKQPTFDFNVLGQENEKQKSLPNEAFNKEFFFSEALNSLKLEKAFNFLYCVLWRSRLKL